MDAELQAARRSGDPGRLRKALLRAGMYQNFPPELFRAGDTVRRVRGFKNSTMPPDYFAIGETGKILALKMIDPFPHGIIDFDACPSWSGNTARWPIILYTCDLVSPALED